jgi:4-hydroxybenzoyl-CoA thioesterase
MASPYVSSSTVRFNHTDPASYVFFPRYFEMIHAAVEDWFTEALGINYAELINVHRIGLPTARTECEFFHPSRLGETVEITVLVERLGRSSITLLFSGAVEGEERLRATSVLVAISLDTGHAKPIADDMRAQIEAYINRQGALPTPRGRRVGK